MTLEGKSKKILVADDEESVRIILSNALTARGYEVLLAEDGKKALAVLSSQACFAGLVDLRMPELSGLEVLDRTRTLPNPPRLIMITAQDTMKNAVEAMKRGAFDYVAKPFDIEEIEILVEKAWKIQSLEEEVAQLREEVKEKHDPGRTLIGQGRPMKEIYKIIGKLSANDVTVLIQGESGTGKELIARAIHQNSLRVRKSFVPVNVAAIPRDLLESELFGYIRGAFTGAERDHAGYFEEAEGGTLFLDEIGDMPVPLQAKLLRVLQEKVVQRVGAAVGVPVNVRIIAATHQNLERLVKEKKFREDLYYRLNVVPVKIPPLRERREDIPVLADFFAQKFSEELGTGKKKISKEAIRKMQKYDWPGNVRELENIIKRAMVLSPWTTITPEVVEPFMADTLGSADMDEIALEEVVRKKLSSFLAKWGSYDMEDLHPLIMKRVEKPLLELILERSRGNQIRASRILGINRNTLRKKIKELKIEPPFVKKREVED
ncbi:MAG: sigma-54-dependent Fis family transcriptional regulator [Deltaproteobacteria bacterium]|nr:sigma-54-dependent Fis family transcriptional regulator [Deltaproteobacteria bacterium]